MKIDCRVDHWSSFWKKQVFLNGVKLEKCFYVDTDEGIIGIYDPSDSTKENWMFEVTPEIKEIMTHNQLAEEIMINDIKRIENEK